MLQRFMSVFRIRCYLCTYVTVASVSVLPLLFTCSCDVMTNVVRSACLVVLLLTFDFSLSVFEI